MCCGIAYNNSSCSDNVNNVILDNSDVGTVKKNINDVDVGTVKKNINDVNVGTVKENINDVVNWSKFNPAIPPF